MSQDIKSKFLSVVKPQSKNQQNYVDAMHDPVHEIVFGLGPAGTGKTILAVHEACKLLNANKVERIILTRPAIEAGEELGSLPGDFMEKTDPFLRPLFDYLYRFIGRETTQRYLKEGIIEVVPLAYMRGRTFENSFVVIDEAQNLQMSQLKMVLTRFGSGKMVINGDSTQSDLLVGIPAMTNAHQILDGVRGVRFIHFTAADVRRSGIVRNIIVAYESYAKRQRQAEYGPEQVLAIPDPTIQLLEDQGGSWPGPSSNGHGNAKSLELAAS